MFSSLWQLKYRYIVVCIAAFKHKSSQIRHKHVLVLAFCSSSTLEMCFDVHWRCFRLRHATSFRALAWGNAVLAEAVWCWKWWASLAASRGTAGSWATSTSYDCRRSSSSRCVASSSGLWLRHWLLPAAGRGNPLWDIIAAVCHVCCSFSISLAIEGGICVLHGSWHSAI